MEPISSVGVLTEPLMGFGMLFVLTVPVLDCVDRRQRPRYLQSIVIEPHAHWPMSTSRSQPLNLHPRQRFAIACHRH
jgi:hypothetical protein